MKLSLAVSVMLMTGLVCASLAEASPRDKRFVIGSFDKLFNKAKNAVNTAVGTVKGGVDTAVDAVKGGVNTAVGAVKSGVNTAVGAVKSGVNTGATAVKDGAIQFADTWKDIFYGTIIQFTTIGTFNDNDNYKIYAGAQKKFEAAVDNQVTFRFAVAGLLKYLDTSMNEAQCTDKCNLNAKDVMGGQAWTKYAKPGCPFLCVGGLIQLKDYAESQ